MNDGPVVDIVRQVYPEPGQHFVEVGPWADGPELVELRTTGKSRDYFGAIDMSMAPAFARKLAAALIACADEVESAQ